MASKSQNSQPTVHVEYCRSCETHSWCTHHDQAKYHETFLKLTQIIAQRFPQLQVIGNMVPSYLIPFKIAQNKYIDSQTNKYVVYPQIGSFQVRFQQKLVYSKKDTNAWPNLHSIAAKIGSIIDPNYQSPSKPQKQSPSPSKEVKQSQIAKQSLLQKEKQDRMQKQKEGSQFIKAIDQKMTAYRDQSKGFTLTDHFKLYRAKPKAEDKDWVSEKAESASSFKQFSQQLSRQKSDNSEERRKRDFNGQTKLKEMLKSRGLMLKEQGRKEMIIKLDSIEEENPNYDQANAATQRPHEASTKINRMQNLEGEFSSLENKFKNFENKVQDIQTKNKQFEYKEQQISRLKQSQNKKEQPGRQSKKDQAQKENYCFERSSKLDQYLNASEEEKNKKLHKIYGEWKLLKQTAHNNEKILHSKRGSQERAESSNSQSQTHSNSLSFLANVITFKPKNDKSTPKIGATALQKQLGHQYSSIQKYESSKALTNGPKFRTGQQFYNKPMLNKQNINGEIDDQPRTSSKLLKKGLGPMNKQALKKYASKQGLSNAQTTQCGQISQFSQSAQRNISHIQSRISNLQNRLKMQRGSQQIAAQNKLTLETIKKVYGSKSRSQSQTSSYSANREAKKSKQRSKDKNRQNAFRKTQKGTNDRNFRKVNKTKGQNKNVSRTSQAFTALSKRKGARNSEAIQENKLTQSNYPSIDESKVSESENNQKQTNKLNTSSQRNQGKPSLPHKQKINQESMNHLRTAAFLKNQQKNNNIHVKTSKATQAKKYKTEKKTNQSQQKILKLSPKQAQDYDKQAGKMQKSPQKLTKRHNYPTHEPVAYLRKQKNWRQSQPKDNQYRSSDQEQLQVTQNTDQVLDEVIHNRSGEKLSDSKQTVAKYRNQKKPKRKQESQSPTKSKEQRQQQMQPLRTNYGRIRKNRSRQQQVQQEQQRDGNQQICQNERSLEQSQPECNWQSEIQNQLQENSQLQNVTQEGSEKIGKVLSRSQKGRMKNNYRAHNLNYYKSQEVCYQGEKKPKAHSNHSASFQSDYIQQHEQQKHSTPQCQGTGRNSENERVSGWKLNSEQRYSGQIIVSGNASVEQAENELAGQELSQRRRNSLDSELQNKPTQQFANELAKNEDVQAKWQNQVIEVNGIAKLECQQLQLSGAKGDQNNDLISIGRNATQKTVQPQIIQQPTLSKKQPDCQMQVEELKTQEVDLQSQIARQYSDYLVVKVANDLVKVEKPQNNTQAQKVSTKENPCFLDCEVARNIINCQSISSLSVREQTVPSSFMDFKTSSQICLQKKQQKREQEQTEVKAGQNVVQLLAHQREIVQQACQRHSQAQKESNKGQKDIAIAPMIARLQIPVLLENTNIQKKVAELQMIAATQQKLEKNVPTLNKLQPIQQQDNVYSQAKKISEFKEIGIQKELTLQVQVQTDPQFQDGPGSIRMVRGSSLTQNEPRKQPSSRQSHNRKIQLIPSVFEESNPVKDNFFVQSRREILFPKKKPVKQIERAHIIDKIYSANVQTQIDKFSKVMAGADQDVIKQEGVVVKMAEAYAKGQLISQKGLQTELVQSQFSKLLKVVQILCEKSEWLVTRLFQDKTGLLKERAFGLWLCKQYQWESIILDDSLLVNQQNHPLYSIHKGNQMWFNVLQKAVAAALGGYGNLKKATTAQLFTMLTGCNAIICRIKQDPNKNSKLLQLVNDCLRKNYVIHAQKNNRSNQQQTKQSIYYVTAVRKSGGENQTLIQLSQNGRQSFWMKLSKFVQQFSKIEILQLRLSHNFAHLDLGVSRPGQLTVVQLKFDEDAQGCVTLSSLSQNGPLRAFLYKQQKNRVLKLVGQARQKSKSHLFFECSFTQGRYFVFTQAEERPSRLAFLGETKPSLTITEQVHSQSLKNDMAEYLPVWQHDSKTRKNDYETQNQWRGPSRLQDNFLQSRLRDNFVEYVLGKSKR